LVVGNRRSTGDVRTVTATSSPTADMVATAGIAAAGSTKREGGKTKREMSGLEEEQKAAGAVATGRVMAALARARAGASNAAAAERRRNDEARTATTAVASHAGSPRGIIVE